ncbi:UbiA family prenyltransferase [Methylocella sp.]|jgi:4-hydroxybenzoate polyprenyltransferase|uniref:UbiA family prenyltransferase n=1 Tax=Methylocella sp. TaxID=1978226 RepID=UPI003C2A888A
MSAGAVTSFPPEAQLGDKLPLVVDLDGTLIKSDLLLESLLRRVGSDPTSLFGLIIALRSGKAHVKDLLAQRVDLDIATLPYDEAILGLAKEARAAGRSVYLASASNEKFVAAVAAHVGLFDGWFASDARTNVSAGNKAARLVEAFGEGGFDYIGNDKADLPVWAAAARRIGVRTSPQLSGKLAALGVEVVDSPKASLRQWVKLIRVHQYAKNALVFLPLLTAHKFNLISLFDTVLAAIAFSLCASSVYIFNDLVDLAADRNHPTKQNRPLASGVIPIKDGVIVMALLFLAAVAIAACVSWPFLGVLLFYFALTNAYTCWLKTKMLIDVVALAMLYSLRVIGGAAAIGVPVSEWLIAFSMFIFASLALIKRYIELATRLDRDLPDPSNRNYRLGDMQIVAALAAASGFNAVTVFALYVSSDAVKPLYRHPHLLWLVCPVLMYWISRMLMMAHRRLVHDDPIVFALQDRVSFIAGALIAAIMLAAI